MAAAPTVQHFINLEGQPFMALTTYRKNGQAVVTPVWFVEENGKLYVMTMATAGKAKRIRNTSTVLVAPCTRSGAMLGEAVPGSARILPAHEAERADKALSRKYGMMKRMFDLMGRGRARVFLEINPA
ncbi:MAG: PPOX class F420-dependent oxidoreductase [Anaerolineae bacterium]|nr:PPOX class F420-dependent oxidoreductase [Anaerolineae bacterium]